MPSTPPSHLRRRQIFEGPVKLRSLCIGGLLLAIALIAAGCHTTKSVVGGGTKYASGMSEPELRDKLSEFYGHFVNTIEAAALQAANQTQDSNLRTRLTMAKLRATRICRDILFQQQPMTAFVDTWALCIQYEVYLEQGEGRETFKEVLLLLLPAAQQLRQRIESVGTLFLQPEQMADGRVKLEEFARTNPLKVNQQLGPAPSFSKIGASQLGWVFKVPLAPFRAIEGVDQTAQAVHDLTFVADRFTRTAEDLAREAAWEAELLILQARREITGLMQDLDAKQTNVQATLTQTRLTIVEASNALARLEPIAKSAEQTAKAVADAGTAWDGTLKTYTQMVKELYPPKPEAEKEKKPEGPPFDIRDYARTAEGIAAAAKELRETLVEFQRTMQTNAVTERLKEIQGTAQTAVTDAQTSARQLTDHVAKRATQVIGLFFVTLLLYRLASGWVRRKTAEAS